MKELKLQKFDRLTDSIPPLSESEFEALRDSIKKYGIKYPIKVLPDGRIIDGYHRWLILGDETPYDVVDLPEDAAYDLGIILNVARRQLSYEQLAELRERAKKIALELRAQGKTQEEAAKIVGIPRPTISRWEENIPNVHMNNRYNPDLRIQIPKDEYPKIITRIENGETQENIAADYKVSQKRISEIFTIQKKIEERAENIKRLEEEAKVLPPLERKYSTVVVDPPWPYGGQNNYDPNNRRVPSPYPEMSLDQIKAIELPLADDAVVFLWTTSRFLPDAFDVLKSWGLEYWLVLVWVKNNIGLGAKIRHQAEFVLVGKKGAPVIVAQTSESDVIFAKVGAHSEKPDKFYALAEKLCPGAKLDYFARKERPGWDTFGTLDTPSLEPLKAASLLPSLESASRLLNESGHNDP